MSKFPYQEPEKIKLSCSFCVMWNRKLRLNVKEPEKIKLSSINFIHETLFSSVCLGSLLFIETTGFRPVSNPLGT
jgi:hypothetical protein